MIERRHKRAIIRSLAEIAAVVLLGPRHVGKTTLARDIAQDFPDCGYPDLEDPDHVALLVNPGLYFEAHPETVFVQDEIQPMPYLFQVLRGHIDNRRRRGQCNGQLLLLSSVCKALLRLPAEALAGRVVHHELPGLDALEIGEGLDRLWIRGGFPDAHGAVDDEVSARWRSNLVRTYVERDIPQLDVRVASVRLWRFWTMLGHYQGGVLDASTLARSLGVSVPSVMR